MDASLRAERIIGSRNTKILSVGRICKQVYKNDNCSVKQVTKI